MLTCWWCFTHNPWRRSHHRCAVIRCWHADGVSLITHEGDHICVTCENWCACAAMNVHRPCYENVGRTTSNLKVKQETKKIVLRMKIRFWVRQVHISQFSKSVIICCNFTCANSSSVYKFLQTARKVLTHMCDCPFPPPPHLLFSLQIILDLDLWKMNTVLNDNNFQLLSKEEGVNWRNCLYHHSSVIAVLYMSHGKNYKEWYEVFAFIINCLPPSCLLLWALSLAGDSKQAEHPRSLHLWSQ